MQTPCGIPNYALSNGKLMPVMGLGTFKNTGDAAVELLSACIKAGVRLIDTAAAYGNEREVGAGMRASGVARCELFLSTKLWNTDHEYDKARRAIDASLSALKTDYVDLMLIHWPVPSQDKYLEAWQALEAAYQDGQAKAIGVCNFADVHLQRLLQSCAVRPMVEQVEIHPYLAQDELLAYCAQNGIQVQAWSPLAKGLVLNDPLIAQIAEADAKTAAQVTLRWHYQRGVATIPKSSRAERVAANAAIFDFALSEEEMRALAVLDQGARTGPDPYTFKKMGKEHRTLY